jgi:hypothetical protein
VPNEGHEDSGAMLRRDLPDAIFDDLSPWLWMGRSVGKELGSVLTRDAWRAWTFAPAHLSDEELHRYQAGSYSWAGAAPTWPMALEHLVRALGRDGMTFVVPDGMASPSDPWLQRNTSPTEIVTAGNEMYWVVRRPDADAADRAWGDGASAAGVIGLVTEAAVPSGEATRTDLTQIARHARLVLFSAYDSAERVIFFAPRA